MRCDAQQKARTRLLDEGAAVPRAGVDVDLSEATRQELMDVSSALPSPFQTNIPRERSCTAMRPPATRPTSSSIWRPGLARKRGRPCRRSLQQQQGALAASFQRRRAGRVGVLASRLRTRRRLVPASSRLRSWLGRQEAEVRRSGSGEAAAGIVPQAGVGKPR